VAGAGFGKTTLLAQAMRRNLATPLGLDVWVSCQPDDQEPSSFLAACCRAAGAVPTGATRQSDEVLAAVGRASPIDVCLVIDDVHQLLGSKSETALSELIRRLPANGHLVLSGRTMIDIPLARLRAGGRCLELGEMDLAFSDREERELAEKFGAESSRSSFAGWPALTRLALTARPSWAYDFLWEEVLGELPLAFRRALLALALAGPSDAATLSRVCGEPVDVAGFMSAVPLLSLTEDGVLRAHDLWSDTLGRLYLPAQIAELLPNVCAALVARNDSYRLADVASRFGDRTTVKVAARELVHHTVGCLPVGRAQALLAATKEHDEPELVLLRAALAHADAVNDPQIDVLVAEATAGFVASGDEQGEITALLLAAQIANSRGAYNEFVRIASRVHELPAADADLTLHVVAQSVVAVLAELSGDLDGALEAIEKLTPQQPGYPMREALARLQVYLLVLAGRADEAVPIADAVLRHSSQAHLRHTATCVRWSAGDPSEIDRFRDTVSPAVEANARDRFYHAALVSHLHASTGDIESLKAVAEQLHSIPLNQADIRDSSMLAAAGAVRLVALHDEDGAGKLLALHLDRHPIGDRRSEVHLRRALTTVYVCAPSVRSAWDQAALGRCHQRMHETAVAFVQARQVARPGIQTGPILNDVSSALEDTDALITMVPLPFAVELAVRAHGLGLRAGARALERLQQRVGNRVNAELQWQRSHGDDTVRRAAADLGDLCPNRMGPRIRIEVLGSARVVVEGRPCQHEALRRIRVRQLLALLVVKRRLTRESATALLWPSLDQAAASRNLRVTLTYLRRLLREAGPRNPAVAPPDERFLAVDGTSIQLVAGPELEVDLWELDANVTAAARARTAGDLTAHSTALSAIAAVWHDNPLSDLQSVEEMAGEVTRVHTTLVDSVLALGETLLSEGRVAESTRHAHTVLAVDPYIERAHRLAVAAQIHLGNHRAARRAAKRMLEALGAVRAVPSNETKILLRRIAVLETHASRQPVS
jgi:LuxR family transcriptional regulator, maltose regulon positive regulatory protein